MKSEQQTTANKKIRLGKYMAQALEAVQNTNEWVSYASKSGSTVRAIRQLESHGLVLTNKFYQYKLNK